MGTDWGTTETPWAVGDVLLVHTDGVTEARDAAGSEFGVEGIRRAVGESGVEDPQRAVEAVAAASMRFGDNQPRRDDHTVVCLQRVPVAPGVDDEPDPVSPD